MYYSDAATITRVGTNGLIYNLRNTQGIACWRWPHFPYINFSTISAMERFLGFLSVLKG